MIKKLPKRHPKVTDGQEKLFNLALKWFDGFLP
jgi:hypothetical protein